MFVYKNVILGARTATTVRMYPVFQKISAE